MTQHTERHMAIFPRDCHKVIKAAYSAAVDILIDEYPEHAKTREDLEAVAERCYDYAKDRLYTDDPELLHWLFIISFVSGYELCGIFFDECPDSHFIISITSGAERDRWIEVLLAAWYKTHGKKIAQLAVLRK